MGWDGPSPLAPVILVQRRTNRWPKAVGSPAAGVRLSIAWEISLLCPTIVAIGKAKAKELGRVSDFWCSVPPIAFRWLSLGQPIRIPSLFWLMKRCGRKLSMRRTFLPLWWIATFLVQTDTNDDYPALWYDGWLWHIRILYPPCG